MCLTNSKNLQGPILISWTNTNGSISKFSYHQPNPIGFFHLEGTQQSMDPTKRKLVLNLKNTVLQI